MEQLYTTKTLAALLRVSPTTIRREIVEGRIGWFKVRGQIRFRDSDVQKYLNRSHLRKRRAGTAEIVYMSFNEREPVTCR